ncbi:hypothetical protein [Arthrobacter sunyaminii]|uniref:hypothetical protein n=1 Tax=Arthrobacter sunyaminii TaxID=2816859 RepID=UPI001A94179D|nr:hypothetical protein [Arthrobacter sunyaminii]MBO0896925.1 hypothetical protein [Arthrobacter sunyaminii]
MVAWVYAPRRENPFCLDLPFDDINVPRAFAMRGSVVPWADEPECYSQIHDAGAALYDDVAYVFGDDDVCPANTLHNGAGLDVSPALNGCLGFESLNAADRVSR